MKKRKIVVLMGGRSPEHRVSLVTGQEVVAHLDKSKYEILPIVISRDGNIWQLKTPEQLVLQSPSGVGKKYKNGEVNDEKALLTDGQTVTLSNLVYQKPDVVFIAMHGPYGEDGTVQGMLELAGLPYTGSGVLASALGMDKIMFRKIMENEGIPIPKDLILNKQDSVNKIQEAFPNFPVVVKPYDQGSSVGVSIVHIKEELSDALDLAFGYSDPILIEEYVQGIEISCGVLGNDHPQALPVAEIVPKNEFFDYEAKYTSGKSEEIVPARISGDLTRRVQETAIRVFKAVGARGLARIDMIIKDNVPVVLEINTLPGLTSVSILPKEAEAVGIKYPQLLNKIIELALE